MNTATSSFYVTGGTLQPDAPSYVERQADTDLYLALQRGDYCYVLTARQMGKSSLMIHTTSRLREEGVAVILLDLQGVGQNLSVEQWYDGLLTRVGEQLDLEEELAAFWFAHPRLGPLQRWMTALREVVLARVPGRVIVFIDEIDAIRSLPFPVDEFFAGVRECYNRRTQDPEYHRLTFCLLGVAAPADLISDTRTSPFNIGRRIELTDFTEAEAAPLAAGLLTSPPAPLRHGEGSKTEPRQLSTSTDSGSPLRVGEGPGVRLTQPGEDAPREAVSLLPRILYWTGGHPYLTQRLCRAVAEHASPPSPAVVDQLCEGLFFTREAREADDNLAFVRNRLLRAEVDLAALLDLYQRLRQGKRVVDDETNPLATLLRLSGVARSEKGALRVRNRIYERVFDRGWVETHMPDAELRRQRAAYRRGVLRATAISGLIMAVTGILALAAVRSEGRARGALALVRRERDRALTAEQQQRTLRVLAQQAQGKAARSARAEKAAAGRVQAQQKLAEASADLAQRQERLARAAEAKERAERLRGARLLYDANMQLAARAWVDGDTRRAKDLLAVHVPKRREEELRSFDWRYQWKLLNGGGVTLRGHAGAAALGAFAPDGHLITIDDDLQLRHWDRGTRRPTKVLNLASEGDLYRPALSHDGRAVAFRAPSGDIRLLDTSTGRLKGRLKGHGRGAIPRVTNDWQRHLLVSLAFSEDDRRLASIGTFDGTARVWDLASRREIRQVRGLDLNLLQGRVANNLALSPNGTTLALAEHPVGDFRLFLLDLGKETVREKRAEDLGHGGSVHCVAYSPDGKWVAHGDTFGRVFLHDVAAGKRVRELMAHSGVVLKLQFSPDSRRLVTGGWDRLVKLWDVATGKERAVLRGHTEPITFLAFSADGKSLASGSRDGTARLWNLANPSGDRILAGHHNGIGQIAFSPDGRWVATAAWDRTTRIWDVRRRRLLHALPPQEWAVVSVAFSPDSRTLVTGNTDSQVRLWDVATGRMRRKLHEMPPSVRPGESRAVCAMAYSPDGKLLVVGHGATMWGAPDYEPLVQVWDMTTSRPIRALKGHHNAISGILFSPDGKTVFTSSLDRTVRVWGVGTGRQLRAFTGFPDRIHAIALSPDGRTIAAGCRDGTLQIRETATGRLLRALIGHRLEVGGLAFSTDGKLLASASRDSTVRLWDVLTGRETRTLLERRDQFWTVSFSPDGNTLATPGEKNETLRLWEAASAREIEEATTEARVARERLAAARARDPRGPATRIWHRREAQDRLLKQQWPGALPHLAALVRADPKGWRDRVDYGRSLAHLNRWREADAELARAAALLPDDPEFWVERGAAYAELGRWDRAGADFTRAVDLGKGGEAMAWYHRALSGMGGGGADPFQRTRTRLVREVTVRSPRDSEAWIERGRVDADLKRWREAIDDFSRAILLKPNASGPWLERGRARAELGQWREAVRDLDKAIETGIGIGEWWVWYDAALARLGAGDTTGYRDLCARLLARFGQMQSDEVADCITGICTFVPDAVPDLSRLAQSEEKAVIHDKGAFSPEWGLRTTLALVLYRTGKFDRALARAKESIVASPYGDNGVNRLLLAMAHHRLGHAVEARRWLEKGLRWRLTSMWDWRFRLRYQLLRREAEALMSPGRAG